MSNNYFTCTLGEAAQLQRTGRFQNVNHLVHEQANRYPETPAVGFFKVSQNGSKPAFEYEVFNFENVQQGVSYTAQLLSKSLSTTHQGTVALLCSSSPEFLFTWLGCIALGHPVLLIAPECAPQDIAHLCKSCDASELIVDASNRKLGEESTSTRLNGIPAGHKCVNEPFDGGDIFEMLKSGRTTNLKFASSKGSDTAYIHHSSGTTGMPKPIIQSHTGAVGALPSFEGSKEATFTTTPLFHGGPADIFRAWSSNAMIWLFPSKDVPITAANVTKCFNCAQRAADGGVAPPVKYFASVPYVLESVLENNEALEKLRNMNMVGVGGAALSQDIGDRLVDEGINLVSRFGSAECGFLLSSHRCYDEDEEWQYVRLNNKSPLVFEARDDGLSELIVPPCWPHRAKINRDDGSYATSDLFQPHPSIEGAWRYHSRADAQLTLATGKKFDADEIERSLVLGSSLLAGAFVFGNGKQYPGALLFKSQEASKLRDEEIVKAIFPLVEKINATNQSQAAIAQSMLVLLPYDEHAIERSSKGTVLRKKTEERYREYIDRAYCATPEIKPPTGTQDLRENIWDIVTRAIPRNPSNLTATANLYSFGVDSVAGVHIRRSLQRLLPESKRRLPVDIIEECGSIEGLAAYIDDIRQGANTKMDDAKRDESNEMLKLVEEYSNFGKVSSSTEYVSTRFPAQQGKEVVLLTGATGALGAHVLDQLRRDPAVSRIYCLVRGADYHAASERVNKALLQRDLHSIDEDDEKVTVLRAKLNQDDLGIDSAAYDQLKRDVTTIMHLAWSVNFQMKLRSFTKDSIAGLHNLMQLALRSSQPTCPKFAFCSSTASSILSTADPVPEVVNDDPRSASETGYARSKWVAEQICYRASENTRLHGRVSIFRVGQLSGDSKTGVWSTKDAWTMMLSTIGLVGCLPDLGDTPLQWLPVDVAAKVMIQGSFSKSQGHSLDVFHLLNNAHEPTWTELLRSLQKWVRFEIVDPAQWIERLEKAMQEGADHPSLQLVDHWKSQFAKEDDQRSSPKAFSMEETAAAIPSMRDLYSVDEQYLFKTWKWIESTMLSGQLLDSVSKTPDVSSA